MSPLAAAVDTVLAPAPSVPVEQFQENLSDVVDLLPTSGAADRDAALRRLSDALSVIDMAKAALLALGCGAIVEHGGDPNIAIDAILARLPAVLRDAARLRGGQEGEPPAFFFHGSDSEPDTADAGDALEAFCRAAVAMLARSSAARVRARQMAELRDLAEPLTGVHDHAAYLVEMLDVLDDEDVVVIHPEEKLGFRVRLRGVADNFQLHTLLTAALIGDPFDGWISGRPVTPRVAAAARDRPAPDGLVAAARFDLFQWRALQPDGTLPLGLDGSDHWLWPEGRPVDIEAFEGTRVVLLGPPAYPRTWDAARRFEAMPADVTVVEKLPRPVVDEWLRRIASVNGLAFAPRGLLQERT